MRIFKHTSFTHLTVILLALFLTIPAFAGNGIEIVDFTGDTTPGEPSLVNVAWNCTGLLPNNLTFQLLRFVTADSLYEISNLDNTARNYQDLVVTEQQTVEYQLRAYIDGQVVAEDKTSVIIPINRDITSVEARDVPNDGGGEINITWTLGDQVKHLRAVNIYRSTEEDGDWELIGTATPADADYTDKKLEDHKPYNYMIRAYVPGMIFESDPVMNVVSEASWFDMRKINLLCIAFIVIAAVILFILYSKRGEKMFIRRIAGLNAVEEAVGRATEMGRSVLFIPGIQDLDDVQTIAGLTILGSVAKLTAKYETGLDVPVSRSLVMSNGREVVKESYLSVGRPDLYNDDIVHYVTDEQFGYVAAVDGIMVREKPATCFYMGAFFAESLILAETGNHVGAIQIAGTAMPTQLPFFVAACDYTLIGEELFAASAYLSGDSRMIASLRGQDVGKVIAMASIALGSILVTITSMTGDGLWSRLADGFVRLFALNF